MGKINILFSIPEDEYPKIKPFLDTWKNKRLMSDKIRRGVDLVISEEEASIQKTFDEIVEKQRQQDQDNKRLDEFAFQVNNKSSPDYLITHYSYDDITLIRSFGYRLELNAKLALNDLDELNRRHATSIKYFAGSNPQ